MNEPNTWNQASAPTPIVQSKCGTMLPDYDLSKEQHEAISQEAVYAFMSGSNDVGLQKAIAEGVDPRNFTDPMKEVIALQQGARPVSQEMLDASPIGNIEQGLALIAATQRQEEALNQKQNLGYVRGKQYGRPDRALTPEEQKELEQRIIADAAKVGIELKKEDNK